MIRIAVRLTAYLLPLLLLTASCGGSTAAPAGKDAKAAPGTITTVEFLQDKSTLENRDCVAVGRVTARGADVEDDLKAQAKDLGGNYIVVNAYTYKRKHLGYGVKGVAYYCY